MPYFGRVTLDRLLAEPGAKTAATGADVLAALDRLEPATGPDAPTARSTFARLPYARALAWWGARMAEALAHAHERGVLHRDVKPSNVLVTADGLPMLLDFNLARDPRSDAGGPSLGGTVAYMAPEHLDALADGDDARVDGRADVFALGVLLFEALTGRRPFPSPIGASSVAEALRHAADSRRKASPSIRETHPEVPAAMEAVVLKCLAVDPAGRYRSASALAADLQAVAEDDPLRHAREPFASRALRWSRRHRWPIVLAVLVGLAWALLAHALLRARDDQRAIVGTLGHRIEGARKLSASGRLERAVGQFEDVADRVRTIPESQTQPPLIAILRAAEVGSLDAKARIEAARVADALVDSVDKALARPPDARRPPDANDVDREDFRAFGYNVAPFFALASAPGAIAETESMARLDPARKARVRGDSETLLFARALVQARSDRRVTSTIVGLGLAMGGDPSPWQALRAWIADPTVVVDAPAAGEGRPSRTSLLLGLLAEAQGRPAEALAWLRRADRLGPSRPGLSAAIARLCISTGKLDDARAFTQKAVESARTQPSP
jgi:tetratricopeptide (TPR) repeat protein